MSQILIVEDSPALGQLLSRVMQNQGHRIDRVTSVKTAQACLDHKKYDIAIIDRGLPDGDGIDLVEQIHADSFNTRLMVVSAQAQVSSRIEAFRAGADDYLVKPFDWTELELRYKRLLSMTKQPVVARRESGSTVFFPETGVLIVADRRQILRKKEAQILDCLWKYKNQIVTKNRMVAEVWSQDIEAPADVTIEVYVRRLRMKLGLESKYITTHRGLGYMFRDAGGA